MHITLTLVAAALVGVAAGIVAGCAMNNEDLRLQKTLAESQRRLIDSQNRLIKSQKEAIERLENELRSLRRLRLT